MSKGSRPRPCNKKKFDAEYERVFGKQKLNVWTDAPPKEEQPDEIQGDTGDGTRDQSDSGRLTDVLEEPGGFFDTQATGPVEPPPHRTRPFGYWTNSGSQTEFNCPHGVGHSNRLHRCCEEQCCQRADFPLKGPKQ